MKQHEYLVINMVFTVLLRLGQGESRDQEMWQGKRSAGPEPKRIGVMDDFEEMITKIFATDSNPGSKGRRPLKIQSF